MSGISFSLGSKVELLALSGGLGKALAETLNHVTSHAPGTSLTDGAGRSMARAPRSIADYDAAMDPLRAARQAKSGNQPGDPDKAAQALLRLIEAENPPIRLFLGDDALGLVTQKLEQMKADIAAWAPVSRSTSFAA